MPLTISVTFINGNLSNATDWNTIMSEIAAKLNGNIVDGDIDSISESKIAFDAQDGHDHGENGGKPLSLNESAITFDAAAGHTHDGSGSRLAALAVANGLQGTIILKKGTLENAPYYTQDDDGMELTSGASTITFDEAFNTILGVQVFWDEGGGIMSSKYLGMAYVDVAGEDKIGYYIGNVTNSSFVIYNRLGESVDFYWRAIGI